MTSKVPGECISSNRSSGKSGNTSAPGQFHPSALVELQHPALLERATNTYIYIIHIFTATYKIDIFKNIWSHKTSQTFKHTSTIHQPITSLALLHSPLAQWPEKQHQLGFPNSVAVALQHLNLGKWTWKGRWMAQLNLICIVFGEKIVGKEHCSNNMFF